MTTGVPVRLYTCRMETGFPSPAQGYEDTSIDLGRTLVQHPAATYCMRMGRSYPHYGIYCGDIVIVDRSLPPTDERLVIYTADGSFKCGRVFSYDGRLSVSSTATYETDGTGGNSTFGGTSRIRARDRSTLPDITIFGTITFIIHSTMGSKNSPAETDSDAWQADECMWSKP